MFSTFLLLLYLKLAQVASLYSCVHIKAGTCSERNYQAYPIVNVAKPHNFAPRAPVRVDQRLRDYEPSERAELAIVPFKSQNEIDNKRSFVKLPQIDFDVLSIVKPVLRKHIMGSLREELEVVLGEIEVSLPFLYGYEDSKFRDFVIKIPKELRPAFFGVLKINRFFRILARAFRESILIGISSILVTTTFNPLVEDIVDSVLSKNIVNISSMHAQIMKNFDEFAVDKILSKISKKISLICFTSAFAFFSILLKPLQNGFEITRDIPLFQVNRFDRIDLDSSYEVYSKESQNIINKVGTSLAVLGIETIAAFITAIMYAFSALLKPALQLAFMIPKVKERIKCELEINLLRAYASMPMFMKPKTLPQPVCPANSHVTMRNVFDGALPLSVRKKRISKYKKIILEEEEKRRIMRINM